jgi:hypothetical protein
MATISSLSGHKRAAQRFGNGAVSTLEYILNWNKFEYQDRSVYMWIIGHSSSEQVGGSPLCCNHQQD